MEDKKINIGSTYKEHDTTYCIIHKSNYYSKYFSYYIILDPMAFTGMNKIQRGDIIELEVNGIYCPECKVRAMGKSKAVTLDKKMYDWEQWVIPPGQPAYKKVKVILLGK